MADRDADFTEFFDARALRYRRIAYALAGDWHLAEDLAQSTFVRMYRHWPRIRDGNLDGYARRTMLNLYLDRRKFRAEVSTSDLPDHPDADPGTERRLDVHEALRQMPRQMRAVVVLRFLEDLPIREVADVLGISEGTVKSHTHHALAALRDRSALSRRT